MSEEPITVSIRDLGLAAALVASGFGIDDTNRDALGRTYFIFQETTALDEAVNGYFSNNLQVVARRYFDSIKMLKDRIYADK